MNKYLVFYTLLACTLWVGYLAYTETGVATTVALAFLLIQQLRLTRALLDIGESVTKTVETIKSAIITPGDHK